MPISPARVAAFDILLRVEQDDSYASELLHSARYEKFSLADHGLATELVMGVVRWRSLLDKHIAERSSQKLDRLDPEVLAALRLGAYQLLFLDRVPERAAVHESVELVKRAKKRSAVPFANAVLRKFAGEARKQNRVSEISEARIGHDLAESAAHPPWLVERWVQQFGLEAARQICIYNQQVPETAVRVNDAAADELRKYKVELAPGFLLTSARRVLSGDITNTPPFREGMVMIQDEASQLVALLAGEGASILDCCAAPGGKTRVLAERNPGANIIAVELHPHRARLLRRLVTAANVMVVAADIRKLPFTTLFDCVLADVPCSGTGTLARNPEIKWRLNLDDIADLQRRQLEILQSAMQCVASGGQLVYSTCSLENEENSDVVEKALANDRSFRLLDCGDELARLRSQGELRWADAGSLISGPYLRTIPGVHPCDGFFAAVLRKS
jgi:16S rRNA (cytosine967-C5)-methyltransferase